MLALLVALIVLALVVAFIVRPVLAGLGAPAWLDKVVVGIALLVALLMIANYLGIPTPNLR